jgi:SAM-dependent methyltransferase
MGFEDRATGRSSHYRPPRLYDELAAWWPFLSPPSECVEEAADLAPRLRATLGSGPATLLELGAGGGSLAFHLKRQFHMTLTDRAPGMLAVSQSVNPECEHRLGDMRLLRLGRLFDAVLIHDAIMYATEPGAIRATLETAAIHCRPGGTVVVAPDFVRETFDPHTDHGGTTPRMSVKGLFARSRWLQWLAESGLPAHSHLDPWGRDVFIGTRIVGAG